MAIAGDFIRIVRFVLKRTAIRNRPTEPSQLFNGKADVTAAAPVASNTQFALAGISAEAEKMTPSVATAKLRVPVVVTPTVVNGTPRAQKLAGRAGVALLTPPVNENPLLMPVASTGSISRAVPSCANETLSKAATVPA